MGRNPHGAQLQHRFLSRIYVIKHRKMSRELAEAIKAETDWRRGNNQSKN